VKDSIRHITDKALIITNDSDIAPAIRMARQCNSSWKAKIITPPLSDSRFVNYDLLSAAGLEKKNSKGQVFREIRLLTEEKLLACQLPNQMNLRGGGTLNRPPKYALPTNVSLIENAANTPAKRASSV